MVEYHLPGDEEVAQVLLSMAPSLTRNGRQAVDRALAKMTRDKPSATTRRTVARRKVLELAALVGNGLSVYGAATAVQKTVAAYQGHRWSLEFEKQRIPTNSQDRVVHELLLSLPSGKLPGERQLREWLK